jgi:hypothetical protein
MAPKRLLVLPHIGTAFGHLIRTGQLLQTRHLDIPEVVAAIPSTAVAMAKLHLPPRVKILEFPIRPTVTNRTGKLDEQGFLDLLRFDHDIFRKVKPDLILGDPGIRAGLLGIRVGMRWEALMHGCYLPFPQHLMSNPLVCDLAKEVAPLAWSLIHKFLDKLVALGSNGTINGWEDLRSRGNILIPNAPEAEPCTIGKHVGPCTPNLGFEVGKHQNFVLTTCSSGDTLLPLSTLQFLARTFGNIAVVGSMHRPGVENATFLGNTFSVSSVVGPQTVVISHGGHGTLKAIRHAKRVFLAPGDIDQLCNSLIAHATWGAELALGSRWVDRLTSSTPLQRTVDWEGMESKIRQSFNSLTPGEDN